MSTESTLQTSTRGLDDEANEFELPPRRRSSYGDIQEVQVRLLDLGFDCGPVDGIFGPLTTGAIAAFQDDRDLYATGELDSATRALLYSDAPVSVQQFRRLEGPPLKAS